MTPVTKLGTLAALAALGLAWPSAHAQSAAPISVTSGSYNADVVVDASPESYTTTRGLDTWNQWGFYSANYGNQGTYTGTGNALPVGGAFTSVNSANTWQLGSYTANNALLISTTASIPARNGTGPTYTFSNTGTMTLAAPGSYSSIGVLNAAAYGPDTVTVTLNYSDNTSTSNTLTVLDWFAGGTTTALNNRRIDIGTNVTGSSGAGTPDTTGAAPGLSHFYENYFTANPAKTLTSLTFTDTADNTGGNALNHSVVGIFAINGVAAPEPGETAAMLMGGLGLLGLIARRRLSAGAKRRVSA